MSKATEIINFRVTEPIRELIRDRAKDDDVTISEMLRRAVHDYLNSTNGHQGVTHQARKKTRS